MKQEISKAAIFDLRDKRQFAPLALAVFKEQAQRNPVYNRFLHYLGAEPDAVRHLDQVPFMPIEFFKTQDIIATGHSPSVVFTSSGTTGPQQSRHLVADLSYYETSYRKAFELFYGPVEESVILALLPSYQERQGSSLIYMVDDLIQRSKQPESGYLLYDLEALFQTLQRLQKMRKKTLLIGVTYALLDFVERYALSFPQLVVMETGGMKGRRKELIRDELHLQLAKGFGVAHIHSEYGMTELLSQAYSTGSGLFRCPPWMDILIRDTEDPLALCRDGRTGGINVIDLANRYSCSFIATQDLGRKMPDGRFEVLGRFDHSDVRGCNLLVQ